MWRLTVSVNPQLKVAPRPRQVAAVRRVPGAEQAAQADCDAHHLGGPTASRSAVYCRASLLAVGVSESASGR
jgi:hypothetical protein